MSLKRPCISRPQNALKYNYWHSAVIALQRANWRWRRFWFIALSCNDISRHPSLCNRNGSILILYSYSYYDSMLILLWCVVTSAPTIDIFNKWTVTPTLIHTTNIDALITIRLRAGKIFRDSDSWIFTNQFHDSHFQKQLVLFWMCIPTPTPDNIILNSATPTSIRKEANQECLDFRFRLAAATHGRAFAQSENLCRSD